MARTSFIVAICCIAIISADSDDEPDVKPDRPEQDYSYLLELYESKTGIPYPCDWWPSEECACNKPEHCVKIESCNQVEDGLSEDCASNECGANYCFCTECEKGYKLRMSECTGTTALADACVVDGDFTQSPREHITCEPEIGCEVQCNKHPDPDSEPECSGHDPNFCQQKFCEGAVIDGSGAGDLLVSCTDGSCKDVHVVCPAPEKSMNNTNTGTYRNVCIIACGGEEGNCEGLTVTTENGILNDMHLNCVADGVCKDVKIVVTAKEAKFFGLNGGDGVDIEFEGTQVEDLRVRCSGYHCTGDLSISGDDDAFVKKFEVSCGDGCDDLDSEVDIKIGELNLDRPWHF